MDKKPSIPKPAPAIRRLKVKIFSPYQVFYLGDAVSVSGLNKTGPFDVLLDHINFFSLLTSGEVVVNTGFQELRFKIDHGIIKVNNNQVTLFVNV